MAIHQVHGTLRVVATRHAEFRVRAVADLAHPVAMDTGEVGGEGRLVAMVDELRERHNRYFWNAKQVEDSECVVSMSDPAHPSSGPAHPGSGRWCCSALGIEKRWL